MGVYLPTGAVGNGRILCTIGGAGEIMTLFYPHIDFSQNVHQLMPALYLGDPGQGRFLWCFDGEFDRRQHYTPNAKVLHTELNLPTAGLTLRFTDFCPPAVTALVRRVHLSAGDSGFRGTLLLYCDLRIREVTGKQSVRYMPEEGLMLQWFRDVAIAVGGARPSVWRCGKSIDEGPRSAKSDLYDGHLNGQSEDIGQVDFALGWHLSLGPRENAEFDLFFVAANSREDAIAGLRNLRQRGGEDLQRQTTEADRAWLQGLKRPTLEPRLAQAFDRALLSLAMLQDAETQAVIAAPEFDPSYELCGGYGYCWPRDATEAMLALRAAGEPKGLAGLAHWYLQTQLPSGHWGQRYWCDGTLASSWALREDFLQVDQTAAAVIALCEAALPSEHLHPGPQPPPPVPVSAVWPTVQHAATTLAAMVGEDGWHAVACDLWETFCGTFLYTNAAIHCALRHAARMALILGEADLVATWRGVCSRIKEAIIASHNGEHFPRGLLGDGRPDLIVDSSTLGVSEPFAVLSPEMPEERALIESNLTTIEQRLNYRLPDGGVGIRRYEGDGYLGGVIGCVNTLWFALVCLQVANSYLGKDDNAARTWRDKAQAYLAFCLDHATPTGLLPELIGTRPEYPYWAAPHAWASGLLVKCALALDAYPQEAAQT